MMDSILPAPPQPEPEPPQLLRRRRWRDRALLLAPVLAFGSVVLTLWLIVAWVVVERPRELLAGQRQQLAVSVRAIALQTEPVLRQAEHALRMVDLWLLTRRGTGSLDDASLRELVEGVRKSSRHLVDVVLVSPTGRLQPLSDPSDDGGSIAGSAAFEQVSGLVPEGLTLGAPLQLGGRADDGRTRLPLLMALSRPVGEYHLVMALIDLPGLMTAQGPLPIGPQASLVMLRGDGLALARRPERTGFVGRNLFEQFPNARKGLVGDDGFYVSSGGASDGLPRVGAFVTLPEFGIKLLLSDTEDAALGDHRRQRNLALAIAIAATLGLFLLGRRLVLLQRDARLREATLQATSNAMPLGMFRCDASGRIVYANDTYLRVHGLERKDLDWGWTTLLHPDLRGMLIQRWKHHVAAGEPVHMLRQLRRADDGQLRWIEVRTAPVFVDGHPAGQAGTVDDVTERRDQEKASRMLNAIFDMTPDFIGQAREGGDVIYLNPAARRLLGLQPTSPLEGVNIAAYFSAGQLDVYEREARPALLRDGHWLGRVNMQLAGARVPMDCLLLAHRDPRGRVETISLLLRDLTEQLLAQRERERSEAMLLAVAHTARAEFIVGDTQARILFFNAAFAQARGVELADWLGRPLAELFGPLDHAARQPLIAAALRGETCQVDLAAGTGREARVLDAQYAPLRVHSGDIEGVIAIEVDVTEARREQDRLRLASQTDALTQLLNRAGFDDGARRALAAGRRTALLYLDLDRFKPVNDRHGHPTGDALLKAIALRLRHALRPGDLVARLGGDEFAVLLPDLHAAADAATVADKLLQAVGAPYHIGELTLDVGVSIGYCVADNGDATLEDLVAAADASLYEAKRAGRGRWRGSSI
jgi:diguanylate cyclase (GGDEF)-like protein/PAS domain S-box-containing protein